MSSTSSAVDANQRWKSWSVPLDATRLRRTLCGVLNKITESNFEAVSNDVAQLAISVEKADSLELLDVFVRMVFARGLSETQFTEVYVDLCGKIADALEGERSSWRRVDPYHVGNPLVCFESSFRLLVQYEFDRIIDGGDVETLHAFAKFVGGLLVEGVVFANDVQSILDDLFARALHIDDHTVAICRFFAPILDAFNASQFLDLLDISARIEDTLRHERLSIKTRYLLLNLHDEILYPQPQDVFSSSRQRIEVYGLDTDDSDTEWKGTAAARNHTRRTCQDQARAVLARRDHLRSEQLFEDLKPEDRQIFVSCLLSSVFASGDPDDATFVATLFSSDAIQDLCQDCDAFIDGFRPEMVVLEDTFLDVPQAYTMMAIMLHSAGLDTSTVADLAESIEARPTSYTYEKFIEEYSRISFTVESN